MRSRVAGLGLESRSEFLPMNTLARTMGSRHARSWVASDWLGRSSHSNTAISRSSPGALPAGRGVGIWRISGNSLSSLGVSLGFQPIVQLNRRSSAWCSAPAPCLRISASIPAATASAKAVSASRRERAVEAGDRLAVVSQPGEGQAAVIPGGGIARVFASEIGEH